MWVQSLGREDPLEEEMATHHSIPAWKIAWTVEPGRLHPRGRKESDMTEATEHTHALYHEPASVFITLSHLFIPIES